MTDHAAIIHVHREGSLLRVVHLRQTGRDSRLDCLYHDVTRIDLGIFRLHLDSAPRWTWRDANHRSCVQLRRLGEGQTFNPVSGEDVARRGDVVKIAYPKYAPMLFTLTELAPLGSPRADVITLHALADEVHDTQAALLREIATRMEVS